MKVSLRTTHDWRIKFKRANEKHSSEQVLHFPPGYKSRRSLGDTVPLLTLYFASRANQSAPRAGTSGFRAPEVLLKYPQQTTG